MALGRGVVSSILMLFIYLSTIFFALALISCFLFLHLFCLLSCMFKTTSRMSLKVKEFTNDSTRLGEYEYAGT